MRSVPYLSFAALVLAALALVPAGAHFFALPNKIGLTQEDYFTAQGIYRGWSLFGVVLIGSLLANLALAVALRRQRMPCLFAAAGAVLMAAVLLLFFAFIYPANQATANWTAVPENWDMLRTQWEYGHAVNAGLTFAAFICVAVSALGARREAV
ncbi:putative transmembrane protein [Parvibaculum lavamentivorans DS-1]|uniref:Putative transmembrane protein n=1 Tax=Parvibaculum lavamentivorans (strain DS-1 / DSM 13023 / NCIMB 13966) TaxID=402881 RepID=A7HR51_PARL1|nr:anthrone oxygenase family protein [Parvibaculum lavamentivorans]ABS62384.1 putative transmembrane protein [Parvibaculum lavamentivorans DS-1]